MDASIRPNISPEINVKIISKRSIHTLIVIFKVHLASGFLVGAQFIAPMGTACRAPTLDAINRVSTGLNIKPRKLQFPK